MANIVPGALWRPIDVGNRARRVKGRGLIGHVAVSGSTLLAPGPLSTRSADWTFYLPKERYPTGERFAQLIDLDLQCWSSGAGNLTCPAFESQGGLGTTAEVNAEPWSPNQVESAAIILAHLHATEGTPLQDMGNSLAGSRGLGVHRYGIDPWRVAGGEVWSSSRGKLCPGDAKVRQIPAIVARAQQIVNGDDMPTAKEVADEVLNHPIYFRYRNDADPRGYGESSASVIEVLRDIYLQMYWGNGLNRSWGPGMAAQIPAILAALAKVGGVDPAAVQAAAKAGAEEAIAQGVDVNVNVGGTPAGS